MLKPKGPIEATFVLLIGVYCPEHLKMFDERYGQPCEQDGYLFPKYVFSDGKETVVVRTYGGEVVDVNGHDREDYDPEFTIKQDEAFWLSYADL